MDRQMIGWQNRKAEQDTDVCSARSIGRLSRWRRASLRFLFSLPGEAAKALVGSSCLGLCGTERWNQTAAEMRVRHKPEKEVLPLSTFFFIFFWLLKTKRNKVEKQLYVLCFFLVFSVERLSTWIKARVHTTALKRFYLY